MRLTTVPGNESSAKFSPDGNWIAFTGNYDGSTNVYVMPISQPAASRGGLLITPEADNQLPGLPTATKLFTDLFFKILLCATPICISLIKTAALLKDFLWIEELDAVSSDGNKILYVRKGLEEYNWKKYKGGWYTDIWMYDFIENKFTPISDYNGKNAYPMWIGNFMYYVSDRSNGIANIFKENLLTKEITQVTNYSDVDVMMPSNDNSQIVYMHDGYLNILDTKSDQTNQIEVEIPSDRWELRDRIINPKEYIHYVNISNDGKNVILEARGDIFNIPVEKEIRLIFQTQPEQERCILNFLLTANGSRSFPINPVNMSYINKNRKAVNGYS